MCEFEAAVRLGRAVPRGKIEAISRLNGYAADVKAVAGKLLRLRGGLVSRAKGLYNARQWETELHDLAKNIDSAVGDLTFAEVTQQGAEVRQQGAAAKHAQQGAAEFYTKILAQQEGLSWQVRDLAAAAEADERARREAWHDIGPCKVQERAIQEALGFEMVPGAIKNALLEMSPAARKDVLLKMAPAAMMGGFGKEAVEKMLRDFASSATW